MRRSRTATRPSRWPASGGILRPRPQFASGIGATGADAGCPRPRSEQEEGGDLVSHCGSPFHSSKRSYLARRKLQRACQMTTTLGGCVSMLKEIFGIPGRNGIGSWRSRAGGYHAGKLKRTLLALVADWRCTRRQAPTIIRPKPSPSCRCSPPAPASTSPCGCMPSNCRRRSANRSWLRTRRAAPV